MIRSLAVTTLLLCTACSQGGGAALGQVSSPVAAGSPAPTPAVGVEARLAISVKPPLGDDPDSVFRRRRDLDAIAAAGFRTIRTDFLWDRIEPTAGVFDFAPYDRLVDDAAARGLEVLALLCYGNPWATRWGFLGDTRFPPDDPADFARYAAATARHFSGRVRRYEVWNEPNSVLFWPVRLGGDARAYGELLGAATRAIRSVDPSAEVCFGGTFFQAFPPASTGALVFTAEVFAQHPGLAAELDAYATHPYRYPFVSPEAPALFGGPEPISAAIGRVQGELASAGAPGTPVWLTEIGWHTAPWSLPFVGVSERDQARFLVRATVAAFAADVELVVWFELRDGPQFATWQEHAFGILGYDPDPLDSVPARRKPAFAAHQTLAAQLAGTDFDSDQRSSLQLPTNARAFRFVGGGRTVTVLWAAGRSAVGVVAQVPLTSPSSAEVVLMEGTVGSVSPLLIPSGVVVAEVTLSADPVYVVSR